MTPALAIDFGTSNTAAAILKDGTPHILRVEEDNETLPTAVFLDFTQRQTLYGQAAVDALIDGREGRFMRALKSVLGTSLMHEKRQFFQERLTLIEVTARFIAELKRRAEVQTGHHFDQVLSGRPVRFHSSDEARNARAEDDLRSCYQEAGFADVEFLPEPEAAARANAANAPKDGIGLVVDIGGGTSDYTVFKKNGAGINVLANHGIRLGGTDFDKALSLSHAMPLFGRGALIRAEFGDATNAAPQAMFNDLAAWEKIPFLYDGATLRDVKRMKKRAVEPEKFERLCEILEMHLGHDVAFAVEDAKVSGNQFDTSIDLSMVEPGLCVPLTRVALSNSIDPFAAKVSHEALKAIEMAGFEPEAINQIVMVGGSSLLNSIQEHIVAAIPKAQIIQGKAFTAIVEGLALSTA